MAASTYAFVATWPFAVGRDVERCVPSTVTAPAIWLIWLTTSFQAEDVRGAEGATVQSPPHVDEAKLMALHTLAKTRLAHRPTRIPLKTSEV